MGINFFLSNLIVKWMRLYKKFSFNNTHTSRGRKCSSQGFPTSSFTYMLRNSTYTVSLFLPVCLVFSTFLVFGYNRVFRYLDSLKSYVLINWHLLNENVSHSISMHMKETFIIGFDEYPLIQFVRMNTGSDLNRCYRFSYSVSRNDWRKSTNLSLFPSFFTGLLSRVPCFAIYYNKH